MDTRDELDELDERAEAHLWREGEREQSLAEMSERARRISYDEAVRWARARMQEKSEAERQPEPSRIETEVKPMTTPTDAWARYIKQQVSKSERAMCGAIADVIAPIEKNHKAAVDELRSEVAALNRQVSELRAESKVRGSLDDVQARLAKLETPPRLKAMG